MLNHAACVKALFPMAFVGVICVVLQACQKQAVNPETVSRRAVVAHYTRLAAAVYSDARESASVLRDQIQAMIKRPTEQNLNRARQAWIAARAVYQQSEVFRFGHGIVDAWEPQVNAWPLDEGLIDYVDREHYEFVLGNAGATANIIANRRITQGTKIIDATLLSSESLVQFNEWGGSEANVATGYHAIEFLLWGQDLNGHQPGAGQRKVTDYAVGESCTHFNCERRGQYLLAAIDLLIQDLTYMSQQWSEAGDYHQALRASDPQVVLAKMLYSMGSLSLGELAGERMKVALEANSAEDEHDCFSDNTHNAHYYSAKGIENVYLGRYQREDGTFMTGPSLSKLLRQRNPELDKAMVKALSLTMEKLATMVELAEHHARPMPFDVMIAEGNELGQQTIKACIQALANQTAYIEQLGNALGIDVLMMASEPVSANP